MHIHHRRRSDKPVTDAACRRFGAIAVHLKFCTVEQVKSAMTEQLEDNINGREHRLLGSILYDKGWISETQIETVLLELRNAIK